MFFLYKLAKELFKWFFLEKFDAKFETVQSSDQLDKSVRNEGGFGSTGNN